FQPILKPPGSVLRNRERGETKWENILGISFHLGKTGDKCASKRC
ncbi:unnamed protein product, partial [Allacma fusca]